MVVIDLFMPPTLPSCIQDLRYRIILKVLGLLQCFVCFISWFFTLRCSIWIGSTVSTIDLGSSWNWFWSSSFIFILIMVMTGSCPCDEGICGWMPFLVLVLFNTLESEIWYWLLGSPTCCYHMKVSISSWAYLPLVFLNPPEVSGPSWEYTLCGWGKIHSYSCSLLLLCDCIRSSFLHWFDIYMGLFGLKKTVFWPVISLDRFSLCRQITCQHCVR